MDYKVIDHESWPRREMYEFFSAADQPFYNVAFRLDVTRAYNFAKENSLSFYMVMTYLVTKAINSVEAFRYAKLDGEIVLFDSLMPSFTEPRSRMSARSTPMTRFRALHGAGLLMTAAAARSLACRSK